MSKKHFHLQSKNGFILPSVIVLTVVTFVSITIALQYVSALSSSVIGASHASAARFAAEAGVVHSHECIDANIDNPNPAAALGATLRPNTNCGGTATPSQPENIVNKNGRRASYTVSKTGVANDILGLLISGTSSTPQGPLSILSNTSRTSSVKMDVPITSSTVTKVTEDTSAPIFAASQVDTGADFTCGVISDRAYCWGDGDGYQLGTGVQGNSSTPKRVVGGLADKKVSQVAAGLNHACAITLDDNQLYCWGGNTDGQLGNGTTTQQPLPIHIPLPADVTQVSAGRYYTCALANARAYCWGSGLNRKTGHNTTSDVRSPQEIAQGNVPTADRSRYTHISASDQHTCAVANAKAYCWGSGQNYKNGQSATGDVGAPALVVNTASLSVDKIDNGDEHTCLIAGAGDVYCWGARTYGRVGTGSTSGDQIGAARVSLGAASDIATGKRHTCAIVSGKPWCWGNDSYGQLGNGSPADANTATPTPATANGALNGKNLTSIASMGTGADWTGLHTCATATDFKIYCWGWGGDGQLGDGSTTDRFVPTVVSFSGLTIETIGEISEISAGDAHTCLVASSVPYCMGYDFGGRNGYGTTTGSTYIPKRVSRTSPSHMPSTGTVSSITAGYEHTCAVNGGRAYCWGLTNWAKLGNDTGGDGSYWVPVQVHNITSVTNVSAGRSNTCAIAASKAYCWGRGTDGRNGTGTTDSARVPARVAAPLYNLNVKAIEAGDTVSCALTTAVPSKVYCWGSNDFGELGSGSTSDYSTVPVITNSSAYGNQDVTDMSVGEDHACLVAAGSVYCWGNNEFGKLGTGSSISHLASPTRVSGLLNGKTIVQVSAGYDHTCAVDSNGTAYCWGRNAEGSANQNGGRLGTGTYLSTNTPLQVNNGAMTPGMGITKISAGFRHTCAIISTGQSYCWGVGQYGRLGNNSIATQNTPSEVYRGDPPRITTTTEIIRRLNASDVIIY